MARSTTAMRCRAPTAAMIVPPKKLKVPMAVSAATRRRRRTATANQMMAPTAPEYTRSDSVCLVSLYLSVPYSTLIHLTHAAFADLGGDLGRAEGGAGLDGQTGLGPSWRHRRLMIVQHQPICPAPALPAPQPAPDVTERHVPAVPVCQLILVEYDTPVARLTERAEGERLVIGQGAEH